MPRTTGLANYSDIHYTDPQLARAIVAHFKPQGRCLEPFKGDGAFLQHLPAQAAWCELQEGRDFFAWTEPVDWIVTNPPFSNLTDVFAHAFSLAQHCVFLMPISKYFSSAPRLALAREFGGLQEILHVGTGRDIGFGIGFPFAALKFVRGYVGPIHMGYLPVASWKPFSPVS